MVNRYFKLLLFCSLSFLLVCLLSFISTGWEDNDELVQNITGCGNLTTENALYTLNQSINITGGDCLVIKNNSIVLDCQGYTITVNGSDTDDWAGVDSMLGYDNITIKNCIFSQNFTGVSQSTIAFSDSENSTIFNNTFEKSGIFFENSINANITANTINYSGNTAPITLLEGSNSCVIENNNITTNGTGIIVEGSLSINISSNNITNPETGFINQSMIFLQNSSYSIVDHNIITTSGEGAIGIIIGDSSDVIVDFNTITTSGVNSTGILLDDAMTNSNMTSNIITTSNVSANGISGMATPQANLLFNNTITTTNSESAGIFLDEATDTNISSNTITTSGYHGDGIRLFSSNDSVVTKNIIQAGHAGACVINIGMSGYNNTLYNNIFNTSMSSGPGACLNDALANIWNTTKTSGTNIVSNNWIGGNYWTNNASTGYSNLCLDEDGDYICDDSLSLATGNVDYLPLADHTNKIFGCGTLDVADKYYALNQSVTEYNGTCFNITANNITLDLNGYSITGNTTGYGVNITGHNDTTIINGSISNFSNGIYISSGSNNVFADLVMNNSAQDAILLEGATSANNNFTNVVVTNTNASHYDINFSTEGINGTWFIDFSNFTNYTFTGAGGLVNFEEPTFGAIVFLEAINGSGTSLKTDVNIESNWVFVNGSKAGLSKSANISFYEVSYTDPKPQYSSDNSVWTDCTPSSDPVCTEFPPYTKGGTFTFSVSHFTYFKIIEGYSAADEDEDEDTTPGGGGGLYWLVTYLVSDVDFEAGHTKELKEKYRLKVKINDSYHYVGIVDLTDTTATINISSTSYQEVFNIGDEKKFDVTEDGYYGILVKLNSIENNKANVTVKSIYEEVPEELLPEVECESDADCLEGYECVDNVCEEKEAEEAVEWWVWIVIAVIVVLIAVGIIFGLRKRKGRGVLKP